MSNPNVHKILIYAALLISGLVVGYSLKKENLIPPVQEVNVTEQKIPECFLGRCPEYFSMDVDGDGLAESAVVVPTAMTQGAGKAWIIDNGKLIFDSGEKMRIGITQTREQVDKGRGFILLYGTEVNSTKAVEEEYIYISGSRI